MADSKERPPLSSLLPPLICGSATFNDQYNPDPYALPTTGIVHRALSLGIRAFDTSPYYGPAEELLGRALDTAFVHDNFPRHQYFLLTKVGRVASAEFDYTEQNVRQSVDRSLSRLHTDYLDVVYCHDVEFVTPAEVLTAVKELRRIRDATRKVRYVGISGYPVGILCELSEMVLRETGEPLDAVMSYGNFTLQNTRLRSEGVPRLLAAGVDVVPNASVLGMGLLRRNGVPIGRQGDFHPSAQGLRQAIAKASEYCEARDEKIEEVAIRFAIESWLREGSEVGSRGDPAHGVPSSKATPLSNADRLGVTVIGVSNLEELDQTMHLWQSILEGLDEGDQVAIESGRGKDNRGWSIRRHEQIDRLAKGIKEVLGIYYNNLWPSPAADFKRLDTKTAALLPTPAASPLEAPR